MGKIILGAVAALVVGIVGYFAIDVVEIRIFLGKVVEQCVKAGGTEESCQKKVSDHYQSNLPLIKHDMATKNVFEVK